MQFLTEEIGKSNEKVNKQTKMKDEVREEEDKEEVHNFKDDDNKDVDLRDDGSTNRKY